MVYLFATILVLLFLLSILMSQNNIVSPSVAFCFGFLFQSIWLILYDARWQLNLHFQTFMIVISGCLIFCAACLMVSLLFKQNTVLVCNDKSCLITDREIKPIKINQFAELSGVVLLVFFILIYLRCIQNAVGITGLSPTAISQAIGEYDRLSKFTDAYNTVKLPFIISNLVVVIVSAGYWFEYVLIHNYFAEKKINLLELIIFGLCAIASVVSGSRTPLFMMVVAGVAYSFLVISKKSEGSSFLLILIVTLVGIAFVGGFLSLGLILGRTTTKGPLDYLFIYCGAEMKNLDIFLQNVSEMRTNNIWGSQTFVHLIKTIGEKIGFDGYKTYSLDLPFQTFNGQNLGNVYTTFYPYIYDFGIIGFVVLSAVMGAVSQFFYEMAKKTDNVGFPSLWTISYGVIFGCLILSFFSNKFYETLISMTFLKRLITWLALNIVFTGGIILKSNRR